MNRQDCERIFADYDIFLPYKAICPGMNYYEMFAASHNIRDLEIIEAVIARTKPEYLSDYQQAVRGEVYYRGNLFMASAELFRGYAKWLFEIFAEAEKSIDVTGYDTYHARVYGFLSEQMLMAWVNHLRPSICELAVGITSEKAETAETLAALADYIGKNDIDGAIGYYTSFLKERPDIRFGESDINGKFPLVELTLDILKSEQNLNLAGLFHTHPDLNEMLAFVRSAREHVALALSKKDVDAVAWLHKNHITWVMTERILEHDNPDKQTLPENIYQIAMLFHSISCDDECLFLLQYCKTLFQA